MFAAVAAGAFCASKDDVVTHSTAISSTMCSLIVLTFDVQLKLSITFSFND
jgi:hypothetical protein